MKSLLRFALLIPALLLMGLSAAQGQVPAPRVHKILIEHIGPPAVSDEFIRANIRTKVGEPFARPTADEDIKNLYATGYFFTIRIREDPTPDGLDLTYVVQSKPILTNINIEGNKKKSKKKLMKKVSSKIGQPLDELKLFEDAQEMQKLYEKAGYQKTTVTVKPPVIDELAAARSLFWFTKPPRSESRTSSLSMPAFLNRNNCAKPSRPAATGCFRG